MNLELFLATKTGTPIIGQIASVMGWIMDGIYKMLDGLFGIQNIGLCIIIFSILIFAFMTPLQIKQQKFSKLSAIMQPEIQKIQKKYQGKKDQDSMHPSHLARHSAGIRAGRPCGIWTRASC